jgi:hypothetical protein
MLPGVAARVEQVTPEMRRGSREASPLMRPHGRKVLILAAGFQLGRTNRRVTIRVFSVAVVSQCLGSLSVKRLSSGHNASWRYYCFHERLIRVDFFFRRHKSLHGKFKVSSTLL